MRIIAGKFRGKKLIEYFSHTTRPTADRIKENIFNVLSAVVQDAVVLDLFAGTGALGIEALSRGAKEVIFVDTDKTCVDVINKNLASIKQSCKVINADYKEALAKLQNKKFNIVFLDPPYDSDFGLQAIKSLCSDIIVFEHDSEVQHEYTGFEVKTKKYGRKQIDFLFHN